MEEFVFEARVEVPVSRVAELEDWLAENEVSEWMITEDLPSRRAWLVAYGPVREDVEKGWLQLCGIIDETFLLGAVGIREIENADWQESYKAHFKASQFGRLHWVPVWERDGFSIPEGDEVVWLDPGLAFGTGNHETTRLCCERLVTFAHERTNELATAHVIDAGCGSGILAISAAKLGFTNVSGFDNDPDAVGISVENAQLNACAEMVEFFTGDLISGLENRRADLLMANILANVLIEFASQLTAAVAPGGLLVLSGILADEVEKVRNAFAAAAPGWSIESRTLGEWADHALQKP
jgi:ribosomal protein L11 methyltransferase